MDKKNILHAPDVEDAPYFEEDFMGEDIRKDYERDLRNAKDAKLISNKVANTIRAEDKDKELKNIQQAGVVDDFTSDANLLNL
jgi:hypothetical protein